MTLAELRQTWTQRRDEWRRLGVSVDGAKLAEEVLADLEGLAAGDASELLTLTDAAREAGVHPDSLGRAIRQGRLPNAGRTHAPRVRRGDIATLTRSSPKARPVASLPALSREAIAGKLPRVTRG